MLKTKLKTKLKTNKLVVQIKKKIDTIKGNINKIGLKNRTFSIVSNNCWGGQVYKKYNLPFNSPFIGLFIFCEDYLKLLENFKYYMNVDLIFIEASKSKYSEKLKEYKIFGTYPIGVIAEEIEIHFLHYKTEKEALKKWNKRKKRINYENLIIKISDKDLATYELLKKFDKLNYENKICFSSKNYLDIKSNIFLERFEKQGFVENEWLYQNQKINLKKYLNKIIIENRRKN